jgi:asparagine synthetase B (glutamine-hydrolysing)
MEFLNSDPSFQKYVSANSQSEFYYKGVFDTSIDSIILTLDSGRFPNNLKGNFGFFYKSTFRVVMAVDHLPTHNLFYTDNKASHIFRSLQTQQDVANKVMIQQRNFFWGGTVGTDTTVNGIKRLEAGTYLVKNLQTNEISISEYINLYEHETDNTISISDLADITEQIIEEQTRDPFNLLWSSGTDSNCVYGFIRKLKREEHCQLISLYSEDSITDERPNIRYLEEQYNCETIYKDLGKYIGITDEVKSRVADPSTAYEYKENFYRTWHSCWFETNIFQKYSALYDLKLNNKKTFTGEAGDQLFGSRFGKIILNLITQMPSASSKDIAELFVSADIFRFSLAFITRNKNWQNSLDWDPVRSAAYQHNVDWTENTWARISCSDTINKIELLQYMYKASHRCYNYGQLMGCDFVHPFGDYRLFHTIFKTPGRWKIINGKTRRLSLSMIENYVDPGPWNWAKSGIQLPTQHTSRIS